MPSREAAAPSPPAPPQPHKPRLAHRGDKECFSPFGQVTSKAVTCPQVKAACRKRSSARTSGGQSRVTKGAASPLVKHGSGGEETGLRTQTAGLLIALRTVGWMLAGSLPPSVPPSTRQQQQQPSQASLPACARWVAPSRPPPPLVMGGGADPKAPLCFFPRAFPELSHPPVSPPSATIQKCLQGQDSGKDGLPGLSISLDSGALINQDRPLWLTRGGGGVSLQHSSKRKGGSARGQGQKGRIVDPKTITRDHSASLCP